MRARPVIVHQLLRVCGNLQFLGAAAETVLVDAILIERLPRAEVSDAGNQAQPQPVIEIFNALNRIVLAEQPADPPSVEETRPDEIVLGLAKRLAVPRQANVRVVPRAAVVGPEGGVRQRLPLLVDRRVVGVYQPDLGMLSQELHLPAQLLGLHDVVGGGPGEEFAPGEFEAVAQGLRQTLIGLREDPHARMVNIPAQHGFHAVAGAVVDNDQLDLAVGLSQYAIHRRRQQRRLIVDGQHDRDQSADLSGRRRVADGLADKRSPAGPAGHAVQGTCQ